jgi:hypothetical protein
MEGRNVALAYRWAEYRYERLPEMVLDLVRHGRPPWPKGSSVYEAILNAARVIA